MKTILCAVLTMLCAQVFYAVVLHLSTLPAGVLLLAGFLSSGVAPVFSVLLVRLVSARRPRVLRLPATLAICSAMSLFLVGWMWMAALGATL